MRVLSFDHVALWVCGRDELATFLNEVCGMHEIERTDDFTLIGGDAREGKLTLFEADGPREPGPLERIVLSVPDIGRSLEVAEIALPAQDAGRPVDVPAPGGLPLALVEGTDMPDLDHVDLAVPDPDGTAQVFRALGFTGSPERVAVGERYLALSSGPAAAVDRPFLNHLALRVDSVDDACAQAERNGVEIERRVEAANTRAAFVRGPDGLVLEYVEHLPGFSLV